jgi:hypothetical protein
MRRVLLLALCLVLATAAGGRLALQRDAEAASTGKLALLYVNEDRFRNYDFTAQAVSATGVDWAISLLFYNNATINRVKSALGNEYDQTGSKMNGRMTENAGSTGVGGGYVWDEDGGRKTTKCPGLVTQPSQARHYRIYADGDDRLYNLSWGYYVFGSTHYDINECSLTQPAWFGYSETSEGWIAQRWRQNGRSAVEDWSSFANAEPYRVEGDHIWENDGLATAFLTN